MSNYSLIQYFNGTGGATITSVFSYGNLVTGGLGGALILSATWILIFLGSADRVDGGIAASAIVLILAALGSMAGSFVSGEFVILVLGVLVACVLMQTFRKG